MRDFNKEGRSTSVVYHSSKRTNYSGKRDDNRTDAPRRNSDRPARTFNGKPRKQFDKRPKVDPVSNSEKFIETLREVICKFQKKGAVISYNINTSKVDISGSESVKVIFKKNDGPDDNVMFYYVENRMAKRGKEYPAFIMYMNQRNLSPIYNTFGNGSQIIEKSKKYMISIMEKITGLTYADEVTDKTTEEK